MKRFALLAVIIIVTSLVLGLTTTMAPGGDVSQSQVMGMPVVSLSGTTGWLTIGGGAGVLMVGFGGVGLVTFTLYGAGLLFGTGQATAGSICMGQAGLGLVAFLGQAGTGLVGAGQVIVGGLGWAQGRLAFDGKEFILGLNADLDDLFRFR
jgi:hypothetical protein